MLDDEVGSAFQLPDPPEFIPLSIQKEAVGWGGLDEFSILVKAEEKTGLTVELRNSDLPETVWGIHILRGERVCLCINQYLPEVLKRFALFHEVYHLIAHPRGAAFWEQTHTPTSFFEREADNFAWAVFQTEYEQLGIE